MLRDRFPLFAALILALLVAIASANRHKKPSPPPTCETTCLLKMRKCAPTCEDSNMRTSKIVISLMALFATTAIAGRDKKPQRTCDDCTTKLHKCESDCHKWYDDPTAYAVCAQHACICEVGKDEFCRHKCDIGGEGSLCFY
ncbi:hypothetical protein E8E12_011492 [Didymella heteroderae]|uniref:Uncharacterized protein n=1 Tax=Didymella heteroderae TaxID=1769908 RepID=A0A9P5C5X1_9PLEO|nr:hypothetical protein E8E12_011492 [Didymella heteroderae]